MIQKMQVRNLHMQLFWVSIYCQLWIIFVLRNSLFVSNQPFKSLLERQLRNKYLESIRKRYQQLWSYWIVLMEEMTLTSDLWTSSNQKRDIWLWLLITLMALGPYKVTFQGSIIFLNRFYIIYIIWLFCMIEWINVIICILLC